MNQLEHKQIRQLFLFDLQVDIDSGNDVNNLTFDSKYRDFISNNTMYHNQDKKDVLIASNMIDFARLVFETCKNIRLNEKIVKNSRLSKPF